VRNIFNDLSREYQARNSTSSAAAKVSQAIAAQASALKLEPVVEKIKVYHFQNSLFSFALGSLVAILIGFLLPIPGFIFQTILWLLLLGEIKRPVLAKLKSGEAENIVVTIPAKSKEVQKVILTAAYDTNPFISTPLGLKPQLYWGLNLILGLTAPVLQLAGIILKLPLLLFWSLLPLLVLVVCSILAKTQSIPSGLTGCSALLESASILTRFRPSITTVVLYFTGAQSLNSGVQNLPALFEGENPTYGLNLVEQNRPEIGIINREGFLPRPGSPLLKELLVEVATEKSIPVKSITSSEVTPSYPLLSKKANAISLAVSTGETNENLRELIVGFIRKIER
jgi:hypothetical protein